MPAKSQALLRALHFTAEAETLKIRALADGTLLLEAPLDQPATLAAGYWLFRLDGPLEAVLREFLNERADARQE